MEGVDDVASSKEEENKQASKHVRVILCKETLQHSDQCKDAWITFLETQDMAYLSQSVNLPLRISVCGNSELKWQAFQFRKCNSGKKE